MRASSGNNTTNCPNCAAPVTGKICPYCGTMFGDRPLDIALGKIASINFEHEGVKYEFSLRIDGCDMSCVSVPFTYNDGFTARTIASELSSAVLFCGHIVPDDEGKLIKVRAK